MSPVNSNAPKITHKHQKFTLLAMEPPAKLATVERDLKHTGIAATWAPLGPGIYGKFLASNKPELGNPNRIWICNK